MKFAMFSSTTHRRRNGKKKSPGLDRELDQLSSKSKINRAASVSQSTSDEKIQGKPSIAGKFTFAI